MKRAIYSIPIFVILFLTACGTESKNNQKGDTTNTIKADTLNNTQPIVVEEKKLTPNDITVKLFTKGFDREADEEGGPYKGEIHEGVSFRKEKNYFFCYDSESFNRLEILGNGKALSIEVKEEDKVIFKEKNFELKDKIKYTDKDFNIGVGNKTTITIKQNETVLFKGTIDSQGCM
jgi:hypothetical protein